MPFVPEDPSWPSDSDSWVNLGSITWGLIMPRLTRKTIRQFPHMKASGLFLTASGEYVADIKPDEGGRVRRLLTSYRQ